MLSVLLVFCIIFDVARDLCFKLSARASLKAVPASTSSNFVGLLAPSALWAAIGAMIWGIEILAYTEVLARLPLNIAFPVMSLTYAAAPLAGFLFLGESVNPQRWFGIGLVTVGVMIVGTTGIG